jgi:Cu(I)-responsive transcriptional regulator
MVSRTRLKIGDLAQETDTKVVTIRYYEQIGLLSAPGRSEGNYRVYNYEHLRRLRFIRRCRSLGFTLDQIRDLLHLSSQENQECAEVDRITAEHLATIEQKIRDLTRLQGEMRRLSSCCQGNGIIADCRVIEALSPEP